MGDLVFNEGDHFDDGAANVDGLIKSLAYRYAQSYQSSGVEVDDLYQVGQLAYLENKHRYDPNHESGAKLTTFLYWYIRGSIAQYCKKLSGDSGPPIKDIASEEPKLPLLSQEEVDEILQTVARPDVVSYHFFGGINPNVSRQVTSYHVCKMRATVQEKFPTLKERLLND